MMKLREAQAELTQLGFTTRPGRCGHEVWTNTASQQRRRVVLSASECGEVWPEQVEKMRRLRRGTMVYCYEGKEQSHDATS